MALKSVIPKSKVGSKKSNKIIYIIPAIRKIGALVKSEIMVPMIIGIKMYKKDLITDSFLILITKFCYSCFPYFLKEH
ncbi:hypothetical protein, partial [Enterococcus faecalis]|uniref:hypothetical protein n=1 Tax=Enterococcus faecalis TaxID=1351 RepID=UPI001F01976E